MESPALTNYEKGVRWAIAFHLLTLVALIHAAAFMLWCFDLYKPLFELVYGSTPLGMWIGIGAQLVITFAVSHTYHGSHHYHAMAKLDELADEIDRTKAEKRS